MGALMYRVFLTIVNIIFPPVAIIILCGAASWDCMLNCALFILAVIPSHIHGFYLTCTYFHRRKKVKKGRYPGGPKSMIHSETILNGGASNAEVERLYRKEYGMPRKSSRKSSVGRSSGNAETVQRQGSTLRRNGTHTSKHSQNRGNRLQEQYVNRDGYGPGSPPRPTQVGD
ncbi:hypothetical protein B0A55_03279 [Lecanosticta acicola]|uniref:Plasma membrane proteolipid 3 n=1 Tax=Lecanosticta acicola TaxID=111012 RepID=A0AAI8W192_9PEZI|nr:hypothetical protein B0A55_03279 [Lecanosticta acicola]